MLHFLGAQARAALQTWRRAFFPQLTVKGHEQVYGQSGFSRTARPHQQIGMPQTMAFYFHTQLTENFVLTH
jgi:hypothetical protein